MSNRFIAKERQLRPALGERNDLFYSSSSGNVGAFNPSSHRLTAESAHNWRRLYVSHRDRIISPVSVTCLDILGHEKIDYGTKEVFNYCDHRKMQAVNYPFLVVHRQYDIPYPPIIWWQTPSAYHLPYYRFGVPSGTWDITMDNLRSRVLDLENDLGFSSRAYWSMRPKFQSDVSLVNTVFELKDFKDLLPLGKKILDLRKNSNVRKAAKLVKSKLGSIGSISGAAADAMASAILTVNLAIKPTIADFGAICSLINQDLQSKFNEFIEYGQEGARSHYSEQGIFYSNIARGQNNGFWYGVGTEGSWKKTATMISYFDYMTRDAKALTAKFYGLEWDAGKIWNALPLSFIVDYFLKIGDALEMMTTDPDVKLRGNYYCESTKVHYKQGVFIVGDDRLEALVLDGKPIINSRTMKESLLASGLSRVHYKRIPKEPYRGPVLPKIGNPSSTQWSNLASLAWLFTR